MAFVYLIRAFNGNGLYKIGKTTNLSRRMRELKASRQNRHLVMTVELSSVGVMDKTERELHRYFADQRVPQSEMFNLTEEQVVFCRRFMRAAEVGSPTRPYTVAEFKKLKQLIKTLREKREAEGYEHRPHQTASSSKRESDWTVFKKKSLGFFGMCSACGSFLAAGISGNLLAAFLMAMALGIVIHWTFQLC